MIYTARSILTTVVKAIKKKQSNKNIIINNFIQKMNIHQRYDFRELSEASRLFYYRLLTLGLIFVSFNL